MKLKGIIIFILKMLILGYIYYMMRNGLINNNIHLVVSSFTFILLYSYFVIIPSLVKKEIKKENEDIILILKSIKNDLKRCKNGYE